ncbi:MAG TPA: phosphate ABC transporter ATP-binding protein PstB [Kiritimatiellia bacterium]|nr:phosphate ABC transporter ATP-binding protein PstB [Kiritimatiellia bacterium]
MNASVVTAKFSAQNLNAFFGADQGLKNVSLDIPANKILGIIGPSGSGKTTFLRTLNRLNDLYHNFRVEGRLLWDGNEIYQAGFDVVELRKRVGMVFALPVPLPMSIYENVVYGPRLCGITNRGRLEELVEKSLSAAFLWDEVKDRLKMSGMRLSGGQQQRLCLARVLAMEPDVVLLDEPCSGLDPISTARIEEALTILKESYTIVLVTNNTKQAARVADNTAFLLMGQLVEYGPTAQIFTAPLDKRTGDYVTGRFG